VVQKRAAPRALTVLRIEFLLAGEADNERERKVGKSPVPVPTGRKHEENSKRKGN